MDPLTTLLLPPALAVVFAALSARIPHARLLLWGGMLALLPWLICALWSFPSLDDWTYGAGGRSAWWDTQAGYYKSWSGRVVATLILSSWSLIGDPWWAVVLGYRLAVFSVIVGLSWTLWSCLARMVPREHLLIVFLAVMAAWVLAMPLPIEGLYWLSGSATYQGGAALALGTLALLASANTPGRWLLAALLAGLTTLTSETVAIIALPMITFLAWQRRDAGGLLWPLPVLAGLAGILVLGLCPGNSHRLAVAAKEGSPVVDHAPGALLAALAENSWTVAINLRWHLLAPVVAVALLLPPAPAWIRPSRITSGLLGLFLLALAPMTWAGMLVPRAENPLWLMLVLGSGLAIWGVVSRSPCWTWILLGAVLTNLILTSTAPLFTAGAWTVAGAVGFLGRWDRQRLFTAVALGLVLGSPRWWTALEDGLIHGPDYARQHLGRLEILTSAQPGSRVEVPRLREPLPRTFHHDDLHFTPNSWQNQGVAAFFGLGTVRSVLPPDQR